MFSAGNDSRDGQVILDILSWKTNGGTRAYLEELKSKNINFVLNELAVRVQRMEHGNSVIGKIQSLPPKQFARLIRAPAFRNALASASDVEFERKIASWVTAEFLTVDQFECKLPVETALGDFSFSEQRTERALTSHSLIIDSLRQADSYALSYSGSESAIDTYRKLSTEELYAFSAKCDSSLSRIQATNAPCYLFVVELVRTLFPVVDDLNVAFRGSSDMNALGRIVHYNPANENVSSFEMAVSIVHEAVHTFLYMHEEQQPFFLNTERAHTVYVKSPWTGRSLHLRGFAHACFVWFAIYHLLQTSFLCCERYVHKAESKVENICNGFLSQQFVSSLKSLESEARSDIFKLLVNMSLLVVEQGEPLENF